MMFKNILILGAIARQDIINTTKNEKVVVKLLDLSSMECVKQFANHIFETENR